VHSTIRRSVAALALGCLVLTSCSSDGAEPRVTSLDLDEGQIGCEIAYGDEPIRVVGPIGYADTAVVELSEDSKALIGNSPLTLHITIFRGRTQAKASVNYADMENNEYVMQDTWIDSAHPGYKLTCRKA